jgi:hypothetical protein
MVACYASFSESLSYRSLLYLIYIINYIYMLLLRLKKCMKEACIIYTLVHLSRVLEEALKSSKMLNKYVPKKPQLTVRREYIYLIN